MKPATGAGLFLADARSRLLPASVPLRFFGAAVVFHLLAWLALAAGAGELPHFAGGLGWPLAALHLVTLGVLVMSAIGASLQLLPVATRQPLRWPRAPALIGWLYIPGVALLTLGMGLGQPRLLAAGAAAVLPALALYALLLADNLRGARGLPAVVLHGWAALLCLLGLGLSAAALVATWLGLPLLQRSTALALHLPLAVFGFMGLLASACRTSWCRCSRWRGRRTSARRCCRRRWRSRRIVLAALAALGLAPQALRVAAIVLGAAATGLHLRADAAARCAAACGAPWAARSVLVQAGLGDAGPEPAAGAGDRAAGAAGGGGLPTLFGLVLVGGWLLSFLLRHVAAHRCLSWPRCTWPGVAGAHPPRRP